MKTTTEMIAIMQAYKNGRRVEIRSYNDTSTPYFMDWVPLSSPGFTDPHPFDFNNYDYRVVPETKTTRMWITKSGNGRVYCYCGQPTRSIVDGSWVSNIYDTPMLMNPDWLPDDCQPSCDDTEAMEIEMSIKRIGNI